MNCVDEKMELFLSQFKLEKRKKISNNIIIQLIFSNYLFVLDFLWQQTEFLPQNSSHINMHMVIMPLNALKIVKKGMMCFTYFPIHGRGSIPCYLILGKLWEGLQMGSMKKNIFSSFPCFFLCSLQCSCLFQFFHISISLSIQFWQEHFEEIC